MSSISLYTSTIFLNLFICWWALRLFPYLGYWNSAAMNVGVHAPFWISVLGFCWCIPRSRIVESYVTSSFICFLRNLHADFHSGCTNLHSHQFKRWGWNTPQNVLREAACEKSILKALGSIHPQLLFFQHKEWAKAQVLYFYLMNDVILLIRAYLSVLIKHPLPVPQAPHFYKCHEHTQIWVCSAEIIKRFWSPGIHHRFSSGRSELASPADCFTHCNSSVNHHCLKSNKGRYL